MFKKDGEQKKKKERVYIYEMSINSGINLDLIFKHLHVNDIKLNQIEHAF